MATLLYGGSFDPITNAHLLCAREAMERGGFSEIIFIPCGDAPFKQNIASFEDRLEMVKMAIDGEPQMFFSQIEGIWAREGKKSYTIDTYRYMNQNIAGRDCYWLIGGDLIQQVQRWHDFPSIKREMKFCVLPRPGYAETGLNAEMQMLGLSGKDVYTPLLEISSTYVRDRISRDRSIRALVPEQVAVYIQRKGLYHKT